MEHRALYMLPHRFDKIDLNDTAGTRSNILTFDILAILFNNLGPKVSGPVSMFVIIRNYPVNAVQRQGTSGTSSMTTMQ